MSDIGPGTAAQQAPLWDGAKWAPGLVSGAPGALAQTIMGGKRLYWVPSNASGLGNGAWGNFGPLATVAGSTVFNNPTPSDSYLAQYWVSQSTPLSAGNNVLVTNNTTSLGDVWLSTTAGSGGFYFKGRIGLPATWFAASGGAQGFRSVFTNPAGGTMPSTFVDCIMVGYDAADANLQIMCNDAAGACTKTNLGANLALAAKRAFDIEILALPGVQSFTYKVTRFDDATKFATGSISTNVPTANTAMRWFSYGTNGAGNNIAGFDWASYFVETTG